MIKCYHFCDVSFLEKLKEDNIVTANNIMTDCSSLKDGYKYLFIDKKINKGNGMFFTWKNPQYKGYEIKENPEGKYALLELDVPKDIAVITDYENWCSFCLDLDEADGDLKVADENCKRLYDGFSLRKSYESIFYIESDDRIQVLLPYIKKEWIQKSTIVEKKII